MNTGSTAPGAAPVSERAGDHAGRVPLPPAETGMARAVAAVLLVGLALLLVMIIVTEVWVPLPDHPLVLRYKNLARALPLVWVATLALPAVRAALPYDPCRPDLPLALFVIAAALSVALGGGHWGDVRSLVGAVGLGALARALFAAPPRRPLLLHYLGGLVVAIVVHDLASHDHLLPVREEMRYGLTTGNPNMLGFLFAMTAPLFLGEMLATVRSRRSRPPDRVRHALAALYLGAAALGTLVTFSRSAAAGLTVGTLLVAGHARRPARAVAVCALGVAVFLAVQRPDVWTHLRQSGDTDRPRIMWTSLTLARQAPIFGIGFGINNLEERFPDRYEALYGTRLFRFHSANQIVDLLVGTGLVGTALALWWAWRLGAEARARVRHGTSAAARQRAAGGFAALVAIGAMSLVEPPLYHGKLLPVLFLVLAAIELPEPDAPVPDR